MEPARANGAKNKERWDNIRALAIKGAFDNIESDVFIRCYGTLRAIHKDYQCPPDDLPPLTQHQVGWWYYGVSGAGKTYSAIKDYPQPYRKISNNKWWDGYQGENNVLIDDLDKSHHYMGYHLKIWADRYAFIAEVKGGSRYIRPKNIVVTSNYRPQDIWEDIGTLDPILRRFKIKEFLTPYVEPIVPEPIESNNELLDDLFNI